MFRKLFGRRKKKSHAAQARRKFSPFNPLVETLEKRELMTASVTVAAFDPSASEVGTDSGTFRLSRTGDPTDLMNVLTVGYSLSGTADSTDYQWVDDEVTFGPQELTATVTITPLSDTFVEGNETVSLTISPQSWLYDIGSPSTADIIIADTPPPTVTIVATDPNAVELGQDGGLFTVSRSGGAGGDLTVNYTISGTAMSGWDYETLMGSVTIWNWTNSATIPITPYFDADPEGLETVTLTLNSGMGFTLGSPSSATVTIREAPPPTVSITATDAAAAELGQDPGQFVISRSGDTSTSLTVYYSVGGTASVTDYSGTLSSPGSVTLWAGQAEAPITLTPQDDFHAEAPESVTVTLSANGNYTIGTGSATVSISDNDTQVSVTASAATTYEATLAPVQLLFSRMGDTSQALTVAYQTTGTALANDYTGWSGSSGTVTFQAGQSEVALTLTPVNDAAAEPTETVTVTLPHSDAYWVWSAPNTASVAIVDNDTVVSIAATDAAAAEAGANPGTFVITRSGDASEALVITYEITGTASWGDYSRDPGSLQSITLWPNQTEAVLTITPQDDLQAEPTETVIVTLNASNLYTRSAAAAATVNITDNDTQVYVTANAATTSEGSQAPVLFDFYRMGDTSTDLTVFYSLTGTASAANDYTGLPASAPRSVTFLAGQSDVLLTLTPVEDAAAEPTETVELALDFSNDYWLIGSFTSATVEIVDNDTVVSIAATDATAAEANMESGTFTISRPGDAGTTVVVFYSVTGTGVTALPQAIML